MGNLDNSYKSIVTILDRCFSFTGLDIIVEAKICKTLTFDNGFLYIKQI